MYFIYHNRNKQRISNNELAEFEYVDEYNNIKPCLLLYFETKPYVRPIRQHKFKMYEDILFN